MELSALFHFTDKRGYGTIALCGVLLGALLGAHLFWFLFLAKKLWEVQWCMYALSMSAFHFGEFVLTAMNQPREVTADSFLLNHSWAYGYAAVASWLEFWGEAYILPWIKQNSITLYIGLACVVAGQALRSTAMVTASTNFTHLVATHRRHNHVLVTHGVYSIFSHPAYVGWFTWSVSTQILLANPICVCAYAFAAWRFFKDRVPFEEEALIDFFGEEYAQYSRRTLGVCCVRSPAREISIADAASRRISADRADVTQGQN